MTNAKQPNKVIDLGTTTIPVLDYAIQGNAILGIKDSGKSYTATYLAEQLLAAGIPWVAFDPIGIWRWMKVPGKGPGNKVVVAGGEAGDLPLTPESAPEIVRAAMRENIPLVLDLYSMHLSKADWRKIVELSIRILLYENKSHGLRHVFLEEAAEFVPQQVRPDQGKAYDQVERLVRMGGNAQLGVTLIGLRPEDINKSVLELCDGLLLGRQKGRRSLESLGKWVDVAGVGDSKSIKQSIPLLGQGEFWIWPAGSDTPIHTKIPAKNSFHPNRRALQQGKVQYAAATDVADFVTRMSTSLDQVLTDAKDNDPEELKRRIRDLERQLRAKTAAVAPKAEQVRIEIPVFKNGEVGRLETATGQLATIGAQLVEAGESLRMAAGEISGALRAVVSRPAPAMPRPQIIATRSASVARPTRQASPDAIPASLPRGERAVLEALIQYPAGLRREQLTVLTGYKRSSRDAYIQRLRERGYVSGDSDRTKATPEGIAALPDANPLPTGAALREWWLARLPQGERVVLEALIAAHPDAVDRNALEELTGYKRSSRDAYLQRLAARELVVSVGGGQVQASDELFGE